MKILWIVPITGPDDDEVKRREESLRDYLFPGTEVVFRKVKSGTESIESRVDEIYATLPVLKEALIGEQEGFDACVIACAGDAGVAQAKELLTIPVVGPGESSILISQLVGRKVVFLFRLLKKGIYSKVNAYFVQPKILQTIRIMKGLTLINYLVL
jgi:allantoin racemase